MAFNSTGDSILTGSDAVRLWNIPDIAARVRCERKLDGLELRWSQGVLQGAPSINGPWNDLPDATSPWLVETDQASAFFPVRTNPVD